jgi:hypothetical protein
MRGHGQRPRTVQGAGQEAAALGGTIPFPGDIRLLESDIKANEPGLALDELLDRLLARGEPLPRSLVDELSSRPEQLFQATGTVPDRLKRLAALASDEE